MSAQALRQEQHERRHLPVLERPCTRAECADGPRPCPWVSCRHHLYGHVDARGHYRVARPWLNPWELTDSCSLDVAERDGGLEEDEVARISGVDRADVNRISGAFLDTLSRMSEGD